MFDPELFDTLEVGDVVEAPSLMKGLTRENVTFDVISRQQSEIVMRMAFFGVKIRDVTCVKTEQGDLVWS